MPILFAKRKVGEGESTADPSIRTKVLARDDKTKTQTRARPSSRVDRFQEVLPANAAKAFTICMQSVSDEHLFRRIQAGVRDLCTEEALPVIKKAFIEQQVDLSEITWDDVLQPWTA